MTEQGKTGFVIQLLRAASGWFPYWDEPGVRSTFLFTRPSFWSGWGSVLDVFGSVKTRYNISASGEEADEQAIRSDWWVVGQDLSRSCYRFVSEHPEVAERVQTSYRLISRDLVKKAAR